MEFLGLLSKHHALHTPLRHISLVESSVESQKKKKIVPAYACISSLDSSYPTHSELRRSNEKLNKL